MDAFGYYWYIQCYFQLFHYTFYQAVLQTGHNTSEYFTFCGKGKLGHRVFPYNPQHNGNVPFPEVLFLSGSLAQLWGFFLFKHVISSYHLHLAICFSWVNWFLIQWWLLSRLLLTDCACVLILSPFPCTLLSLMVSQLQKHWILLKN